MRIPHVPGDPQKSRESLYEYGPSLYARGMPCTCKGPYACKGPYTCQGSYRYGDPIRTVILMRMGNPYTHGDGP